MGTKQLLYTVSDPPPLPTPVLFLQDSTLLRTMVDASQKMAKGNVNDPPGVSGTPGHGNTPSRARNSTPSRGHTVVTRSNSGTPNRVRGTVTPWGSGAAVPRSPGVQMQEDVSTVVCMFVYVLIRGVIWQSVFIVFFLAIAFCF